MQGWGEWTRPKGEATGDTSRFYACAWATTTSELISFDYFNWETSRETMRDLWLGSLLLNLEKIREKAERGKLERCL